MTESSTQHFLLALIAVPAAMVLFAPALLWLNGLFLGERPPYFSVW
jgi:hypothetical protein